MNDVPPDEPSFVLRASDVLAPIVLQNWILLAKQLGTPDRIIKETEEILHKMMDWKDVQIPGRRAIHPNPKCRPDIQELLHDEVHDAYASEHPSY